MMAKSKPRKSRGLISRRRFGTLAGGSLAMGFSCKNNPTGPGPTPTPGVLPNPLPNGIANATALQNLQLVTSLEKIIRPQGILYSISCLETDINGRCKADRDWGYAFSYETATSERRYDSWSVYGDGRVSYLEGSLGGIRGEYGDISPFLQFDSDRAASAVAQLSRECIDRHPDGDWNYQMAYQFRSGVPTISALLKRRGQFNPIQSEVLLDSRNGSFLNGSFSCTD